MRERERERKRERERNGYQFQKCITYYLVAG